MPAALAAGVVSLYRTLDGELTHTVQGVSTTFTMDGSFIFSGLTAGTYIAEFVVRESAEPSRLSWSNAGTLTSATTFTLTNGNPFNLGIVTVPEGSISSVRLSGADRFATAVEISRSPVFAAANPVVYIANGSVPWDDCLPVRPPPGASCCSTSLTRSRRWSRRSFNDCSPVRSSSSVARELSLQRCRLRFKLSPSSPATLNASGEPNDAPTRGRSSSTPSARPA